MIIYKITNNLIGKSYIGQTIRTLQQRWSQHVADKQEFCKLLSRAIKKYGKENFSIKVLAHCDSIKEMNHREPYYIKLFNTLHPSGYNLATGGKNFLHSECSKQLMSKAHKGAKHSEEWKKQASHRLIGNQYRKGKPHTKEQRDKISKAVKTQQLLKSIQVLCIQNNAVYSSLSEAGKSLGISAGHISDFLKGKRRSADGYTFCELKNE